MNGTLSRRIRDCLPQSARFVIAGGLAAGINWAIRFPLSLIMSFPAAVIVSALIGMLVGFVLYREFVFEKSPRPLALQVRDFVAVNVMTSVLVLLATLGFRSLLLVVTDRSLSEALAHAAGIALGAVANYAGHRAVTFKDPDHRGGRSFFGVRV